MRRQRTVMTDSPDTMTQEGAAPAGETTSVHALLLYTAFEKNVLHAVRMKLFLYRSRPP